MWSGHDGCRETVSNAWSHSTATGLDEMVSNLKRCQMALSTSDKASVGSLKAKISALETKLGCGLDQLDENGDIDEIDRNRDEFDGLLQDEEVY